MKPISSGMAKKRGKRHQQSVNASVKRQERRKKQDRRNGAAQPMRLSKGAPPSRRPSQRCADPASSRWIPRPNDELRYDHAVIASNPDPDGIGRMDWSRGVQDAAGWQSAAYAIVRIASCEGAELLNTVAPTILEQLNLEIGGRNARVGDKLLHIGVEVLLSRSATRSGAHYDSTASLLIPIYGTRTVWSATRAAFGAASTRWPGEERALRRSLDPAEGAMSEAWQVEKEVGPGELVCLPRLGWHSVHAEAGSLALSVSVIRETGGSGDEEVLSFARLSIGAPTRPARKGWRGPDSFARMWNDAFGERPTRTRW